MSVDLTVTNGRLETRGQPGWAGSARRDTLSRSGEGAAQVLVYSAVLASTDVSCAVIALWHCLFMDGGGRPLGTHTRDGDGQSREAETWRRRDAETRRGDASTETRARRLGQSRWRREVETGGPHCGAAARRR